MFDPEAGSWFANDGILDVMQLKEINDGVDVSKLLLVRHRSGLSKEGREFKCFADRGCRKMSIGLLAVTRDIKKSPHQSKTFSLYRILARQQKKTR